MKKRFELMEQLEEICSTKSGIPAGTESNPVAVEFLIGAGLVANIKGSRPKDRVSKGKSENPVVENEDFNLYVPTNTTKLFWRSWSTMPKDWEQ